MCAMPKKNNAIYQQRQLICVIHKQTKTQAKPNTFNRQIHKRMKRKQTNWIYVTNVWPLQLLRFSIKLYVPILCQIASDWLVSGISQWKNKYYNWRTRNAHKIRLVEYSHLGGPHNNRWISIIQFNGMEYIFHSVSSANACHATNVKRFFEYIF